MQKLQGSSVRNNRDTSYGLWVISYHTYNPQSSTFSNLLLKVVSLRANCLLKEIDYESIFHRHTYLIHLYGYRRPGAANV